MVEKPTEETRTWFCTCSIKTCSWSSQCSTMAIILGTQVCSFTIFTCSPFTMCFSLACPYSGTAAVTGSFQKSSSLIIQSTIDLEWKTSALLHSFSGDGFSMRSGNLRASLLSRFGHILSKEWLILCGLWRNNRTASILQGTSSSWQFF